MKYLETNLICILNFVSLLVGMLHIKFLKGLDKHTKKNCCSYIYESELMKIEALSCMIKYLPCFLVNFQASINASLPLAKCT